MAVPIKTSTSAVDVNALYENTISNYITSGYNIISQSENSTEMAYKKKTNLFFVIFMCLFSAFIFLIPWLIITALDKGTRVFIRITKTGELKIDGYTLERKEKERKKSVRMGKIWGFYLLIQILFVSVFSVVAYITHMNNNLIPSVLPVLLALSFVVTPCLLIIAIKKDY